MKCGYVVRCGSAVNADVGTMRSTVAMRVEAALTISLSIHNSFGSTRTLPCSSAAWACTTATSTASGVHAR